MAAQAHGFRQACGVPAMIRGFALHPWDLLSLATQRSARRSFALVIPSGPSTNAADQRDALRSTSPLARNSADGDRPRLRALFLTPGHSSDRCNSINCQRSSRTCSLPYDKLPIRHSPGKFHPTVWAVRLVSYAVAFGRPEPDSRLEGQCITMYSYVKQQMEPPHLRAMPRAQPTNGK